MCFETTNCSAARRMNPAVRAGIALLIALAAGIHTALAAHHLSYSSKPDIDCSGFEQAANVTFPRFGSSRAGGQEATQTVVYPNAFLLGALKAASTFLLEMHGCWGPADKWTDELCSSRPYVLPPLGTMGKELRMYTLRWEESNWEQYGGPSLPIRYWDYGAALRKYYSDANRSDCGPCLSGYRKLAGNQCNAQDLQWKWCTVDDHICTKAGDGFRLQTAYPDRGHLSSKAMILDSTPNYLMTPQVPRRIYENAWNASAVKFIVLLREPIARTFSEWSMYGFKNYKRDLRPFHQAINEELREFRRCKDEVLSSNNSSEDNPVFHSCFTGEGMQYVRNSLYSLGLREWFKYFKREQFLLLDTDRLKFIHPPKLMAELARFLGIEYNRTYFAQEYPRILEMWESQCRSPKSKKAGAMHMTVGSKLADKMKSTLTEFFLPYYEELKAMIPDFVFFEDWATKL